ncbi:hypothetical protein L6164_004716 [Bauhinia variegata]|uniref:Uncharacterized protein n=1 Tax=Bauhinia variegata TaxID=167791 RepID=A0ACB9PP84_BAUVA|nr:hypothetical protein L6164_004716 [Bauhinia variegata]
MDSLKKSFKSYGSYKHSRKISSSAENTNITHEELPILFDQEDRRHHYHHHRSSSPPLMSNATTSNSDRGEVIVKIDDGDPAGAQGGAKIWRGSSYDFWPEGSDNKKNVVNGRGGNGDEEGFMFRQGAEDPPTKLIGNFLYQEKTSSEMSLDMDLDMDELKLNRNLPPVDESPVMSPMKNLASKDVKVSFEEPDSSVLEVANESVRRRHNKDGQGDQEFSRPPHPPQHDRRQANDGDGEVLRCTSNRSYERNNSTPRKSTLLRNKTKSRLHDPPEEQDRRSGRLQRSGQLFSGMLGKKGDDDEADPFLEDDIPVEFKKNQFSIWVFLEWLSLVLIVGALICTLCIPYIRDKTLWNLKLWKWEVMVLVLICGRLVSDWVIRILVFFIERNFLLRKRVLYFVYGVRKAVQNCLWLGFVLIAWHMLFDKRVETETRSDFLEYITKILLCFLIGTLIWLLKTLVVKVLASSFHVSTYFDRIQEALFNQFVIETLSGPPLIELQKSEEEEERLADEVQKLQNAGINIPPDLKENAFSPIHSTRLTRSGVLPKSPLLRSGKLSHPLSNRADDGITIDHLHKLNPKNISAWNMKRLMNIVRHGAISTLDEQILDSAHGDDNTKQIRSENEAKAAAKKIFHNVARRGSRYIFLEDLMRFLREDEAVKAMNFFEGASESGKISKSALKNWVVNAYRERRALSLSLNDTKTAVNKLHRMLNFIVAIVVVVIALLILEIASGKFLLLVSSQIVVVAFIFGNTCRTIFEAIIFLFVMHPFDVGDRCEIEGVQMIVEEMNILTTIFLRHDNQRIMYPNNVLATMSINNYYRSPDMGDTIEFYIHVATPLERIAQMKYRIESYIDNKKEHWYPAPIIVLRDFYELNMVKVSIWPTHRMNHQDMVERLVRRSLLIEEIIKIIRELDIQYRLQPLDVSIRSMPTTSERLPPSWATITST